MNAAEVVVLTRRVEEVKHAKSDRAGRLAVGCRNGEQPRS